MLGLSQNTKVVRKPPAAESLAAKVELKQVCAARQGASSIAKTGVEDRYEL
jgi:hypothetical protein